MITNKRFVWTSNTATVKSVRLLSFLPIWNSLQTAVNIQLINWFGWTGKKVKICAEFRPFLWDLFHRSSKESFFLLILLIKKQKNFLLETTSKNSAPLHLNTFIVHCTHSNRLEDLHSNNFLMMEKKSLFLTLKKCCMKISHCIIH